MWTTVALVAALSTAPGQASPGAGQLTLSNVRNTYGFLGAERADDKLLPGDSYFVTFDIQGIKVSPEGKVLYSMAMEVTDAKGKVQFRQDPKDLETFNTLGGTQLPAFAHVDIGLDQPPGDYTVKVTVTDRTTKATQSLTRKIEVLPRAFGLVRPQLTNGGSFVPPLGVPGQEYLIHFAAIGFERDKAKKQPNVSVEMTILDEAGKPTLSKPFTGEVTDNVPADAPAVPMQFLLKLNRSGKFRVELKATDLVSKKTATLRFPLTVIEQK